MECLAVFENPSVRRVFDENFARILCVVLISHHGEHYL